MSSKKAGDDAASKAPTKTAPAAPMLISLDFSALINTIQEQNNRIEMLEMQLQNKGDEVAALTAAVKVSAHAVGEVFVHEGFGYACLCK